jgi:hypothetical protein
MKLLIFTDSERTVDTGVFVDEVVDNILSNVIPEIEIGHTESRKGRRFQSYDSEVTIPEESLRDAIREVFDRWAGE